MSLTLWIHHFGLVKSRYFTKNLDIKKTLSAGLLLSAVGSFLYSAATMESFPFS
jgi:fucose permease